jgi:hypothetical protein
MDNQNILRLGLIILSGVVLLYLFNRYTNKQNDKSINEGFTYADSDEVSETEELYNDSQEQPIKEEFNSGKKIEPNNPIGTNATYEKVQNNDDLKGNQFPTDCFPKDQLTPSELLPADANSTWAQVNPAGQGELGDQNFLNAGYHVGVNTVGQTLRNANLQLRSEPPNPQVKVSPWLQSTIEPDSNRKPMEIGGCE